MGNNQSNQSKTYKYEDFKIIDSLKTGAFGRIYLVEHKTNKEQFIMKRLSYVSEKEKKMADEEIEMLKLAQSRYTVELITGFLHDVDICILQEYCQGGNLRDLIVKMKTWTVDDKTNKCYSIFFQVLMSLKHLHSLKIVHRDLKPENIFMDKDGNAKTGDFGLALKMASKSKVSAAGTQNYQPPEVHTQNQMTEASDIWALGVIVVEMITSVHPFQGQTLDETIENIKNGRFKLLPDYVQSELKAMIINMINVDHIKRPTAEELLESNLMQLIAKIENEKEEREKMKLMQQLQQINLSNATLQQIGTDLKKPLVELVDETIRKRMIDAGIVEGLIFTFENHELNLITRTHSLAFFWLVNATTDKIKLLIYNKNPYPGLIHLLEHSDDKIANDAIISIFLLLETGTNTNQDNEHHPHFESIQACDGINKIFALFQKNVRKYSRDRSALCIGFLFRAREIADPIMRQEIISHLKSLLSDSDAWVKERAKDALKYLAQNESNRSEILSEQELKRIEQDLKKPCNGTEEQQKNITQRQENDLLFLSSILEGRNEIELRKRIISSGIVESLLIIFTNRSYLLITRIYSETFFNLTSNSSDEIKFLIYNKKPYPGLFCLLEHPNVEIASDAIASIFLLLESGSNTTPYNDPHPHYEIIQAFNKINNIFYLFQKNVSKYIIDRAALCIGYIFKARRIADPLIRQETISHLKSLLSDSDDWLKNRAEAALKYLYWNNGNRSEILNETELKNIDKDLKLQIEGTEKQQRSILQKQENDLLLIQIILKDCIDNFLRQRIIASGIIESLLLIFTSRDLNLITRTYSSAFFDLTYNSSDEVKNRIYSKNPYPGLIRLLEHPDEQVVSDAIIQ
ncbi:MAG: putative NEK/NEK2 protein kinase, partial [Streblomastix strix]